MTNQERLKSIRNIEITVKRMTDGIEPKQVLARLCGFGIFLGTFLFCLMFSLSGFLYIPGGAALSLLTYHLVMRNPKGPLSNQDRLAREITAYQPLNIDAYKNLQKITAQEKYIPLDAVILFVDDELSAINDIEFTLSAETEKFITKIPQSS